MTAKEYYDTLEELPQFTQLTPTGISENLDDVFAFAESFSQKLARKMSIEFATWLQDNYSQNKYAGSVEMLPKGTMREDFTTDFYTIEILFEKFSQSDQ